MKLNRAGSPDYTSFHKVKCMICHKPDSLTLIPYWGFSGDEIDIKGFTEEELRSMAKNRAQPK